MFNIKPKIPVVVHLYDKGTVYHTYERNFFALPEMGSTICVEHYGDHFVIVDNITLVDKHDPTKSYFVIETTKCI